MSDPREPFYRAQDDYEAAITRLLRQCSDEELVDIDHLFTLAGRRLPDGSLTTGGLHEVPVEYWGVAPKVRARVHQELRRRAKENHE